ncbi:MAG: uL15 family ribosomal protein [Candidatus Woesearchaeota archaeon]
MTARKRKKNVRQRGSKTHGGGSMKKRRGKGHRGGSGNAGTGKRADTNKPSIWNQDYFGSKGFVVPNKKRINGLNIAALEEKYNSFIKKGIIKEESDLSVVDFNKLNIGKLLSTGNPTKKYKIIVDQASGKAIEKINATGGEVIVKIIIKKSNVESKDSSKSKKTAQKPKNPDKTKKTASVPNKTDDTD